jgi:hypothetical protein
MNLSVSPGLRVIQGRNSFFRGTYRGICYNKNSPILSLQDLLTTQDYMHAVQQSGRMAWPNNLG